MKRLLNKTAIVTGAGSGMGKAIAELFAKEGANVILTDLNLEAIETIAAEIQQEGGKSIAIKANIANEKDIETMITTAITTYGKLDILVNNAGVMDNFKPVGEADNDTWDRVISINLTGPFKAARAAIHVMEKQDTGGVIINNASIGGLFGARGGAAYVASKHGLLGLTKNIASTYGTFGKIRCNAIAPGGVKTNIGQTITDPSELGYKAILSAGESTMGIPEQIATIALFLASDESSFVNGAVITADGGWTAR